MLKIYKIPDKTIFRLIFAFIIVANLKYFFLIFQIPYTMTFVPYLKTNKMYSQTQDVKEAVSDIKDFYDEGYVGFATNTPQEMVFDKEKSILDYYLVQSAIVPSILKNDTEKKYVIGVFPQKEKKLDGFKLVKKINNTTYLYKRID